jgi:hypothetical protein
MIAVSKSPCEDLSSASRRDGGDAVKRAARRAESHRDHAHRCQHAAALHAAAAGRPGATLSETYAEASAACHWAHQAQQAAACACGAVERDCTARSCGAGDSASTALQQAHAAATAAVQAARETHRFACDGEAALIGVLAAACDEATHAGTSAQLARTCEAIVRLEAGRLEASAPIPDGADWHVDRTCRYHRLTALDAERAALAARHVHLALETAQQALQSAVPWSNRSRRALAVLAVRLARAAASADRSMRLALDASERAARTASEAHYRLQLRQLQQCAARGLQV